jgi:hypothetical protein
MADKIKLRRDTQANWEAVNPILDEGEIGVILDSNAIVIGDGITAFKDLQEIPNQELPNEYFNIYKNSKLLFESTTNFYGLPHNLVTDPATMKQYIVARKAGGHGVAPSQLVKIRTTWKDETVLLDGTTTNLDYRDGVVVYHNNIPYQFITIFDTTVPSILGIMVTNLLTGAIIKEDYNIKVALDSYISINNDVYFVGYKSYNLTSHDIIKYSFDTNTFTILNTFTTPTNESESTLGKINGKFFIISRAYDIPNISFNIHLLNDDWTVKKTINLDLGYIIPVTTPYVFRKGNKVLFTFISRSSPTLGTPQEPGYLFTYEITEEADNFNFELKNVFSPLLHEDMFYSISNGYIYPTGYQFPVMLPFSKTGLILVEDRRTPPTYKTRFYQLDYDNDISVDYTDL